MKHLENTPWWICDPEDNNYVAYSDTDSIYIHAEPLLRNLYSNFGFSISIFSFSKGKCCNLYDSIISL